MRAYLSSIFIIVAVIAQSQAFLQEKLSLLKSLKSGFEGGFGSGGGGGFGGGYGGNYGGGYGGSYGGSSSGGYNYPAPSRPLYNGGESYGRSSYYNTGNVGGGEQIVKVIKVIVPAQQNSYVSSGYNGASTYTSGAGYASSWAPAPQPQLIAPQPVQISQPVPVQYSVQATQPAPVQYRVAQLPPVQTAPVEYRTSQAASVQVQQPVELPQPVQYTTAQAQYAAPQQVVSTQQVVQPQPVAVTNSVYQQPQTVVKTLKLIVSEEGNGQVASYAPASESTGYGSGYGANSAAWSQGQNNIGGGGALWGKGWQRGGIWQKLGC